jgi:hypothetical protein
MDTNRVTENWEQKGGCARLYLVPSSRWLYKMSQPQRETEQPVHCSDDGLRLRRCSGPGDTLFEDVQPRLCALEDRVRNGLST